MQCANRDILFRPALASHQFHANILATLDSEGCPLHSAFSDPDVRSQLGLAKDFRNYCKDVVDERAGGSKAETIFLLIILQLRLLTYWFCLGHVAVGGSLPGVDFSLRFAKPERN